MKAGREHRVPLSDAALEVIEHARPLARGGLLFPGRGQGPISDMTMTALMKRRGLEARPHGFRSSFRVWCAEATDTPREIAEAALAHSIAGKVEAAYQRSDHLERRRNLMARWADHVQGRSGALVSLVRSATVVAVTGRESCKLTSGTLIFGQCRTRMHCGGR